MRVSTIFFSGMRLAGFPGGGLGRSLTLALSGPGGGAAALTGLTTLGAVLVLALILGRLLAALMAALSAAGLAWALGSW